MNNITTHTVEFKKGESISFEELKVFVSKYGHSVLVESAFGESILFLNDVNITIKGEVK